MVFALVEDVAQDRDGVAAAGESRAGDHVEGDPDAPWEVVGEAGNDPDSEDETIEKDGAPDAEEDHHEGDELLVEGAANGLRVAMTCHYPSSFFCGAAVPPHHEPEDAVERHRGDEAPVDPVLDVARLFGGALVTEGRQSELLEAHDRRGRAPGCRHRR